MVYQKWKPLKAKSNAGIAIAANSAASDPDPFAKYHAISTMVARSTFLSPDFSY